MRELEKKRLAQVAVERVLAQKAQKQFIAARDADDMRMAQEEAKSLKAELRRRGVEAHETYVEVVAERKVIQADAKEVARLKAVAAAEAIALDAQETRQQLEENRQQRDATEKRYVASARGRVDATAAAREDARKTALEFDLSKKRKADAMRRRKAREEARIAAAHEKIHAEESRLDPLKEHVRAVRASRMATVAEANAYAASAFHRLWSPRGEGRSPSISSTATGSSYSIPNSGSAEASKDVTDNVDVVA
jgi:hypothetical protein